MHPQNLSTAPRIVAPGGPVSAAVRAGRGERERIRAYISDRIEAMIALMDRMDGDPDLDADHTAYRRQPDGTFATVGFSTDDEPSLCGVGTHDGGSGNLWQGYPREGGNYGDSSEDLEAENEHAADDDGGERTLGWADNVGQLALGPNTDDGEPSLGAPETYLFSAITFNTGKGTRTLCDQTHWADGSKDDREQDAGDDREEENEHGGDIQDEPHDAETDKGAEEDEGTHLPRYCGGDTRTRELVCDARMGLDAVRLRKAKAAALVGNLRLVVLPIGWRS